MKAQIGTIHFVKFNYLKKQEEQCAVQSVVRCRSVVIICSIAVVHLFIYCFTKIEACKRDNTYRITALLAN